MGVEFEEKAPEETVGWGVRMGPALGQLQEETTQLSHFLQTDFYWYEI